LSYHDALAPTLQSLHRYQHLASAGERVNGFEPAMKSKQSQTLLMREITQREKKKEVK